MSDEMALHVVYLDGVASSGEDEAVERTVPQSRPERQFVMASPEVGDSPGGLAVDSGGDMKVEDTAGETGPTASDERSPAASDGGIIFPPPAAELSTQGARHYGCGTCGKQFRKSSDLQTHIRIHTGEQPYECETCGQKFTQRTGLKYHEMTHTGQKRHNGASCDVCGKVFTRLDALKRHMLIHSGEKPYSCEICGMKFNQSSILKIHGRVHTGEKSYACSLCSKHFVKAITLKDHMHTHTGEKPYTCGACGAAFTWSSNLHGHKKVCGVKPTDQEYKTDLQLKHETLDLETSE